MKSLMIYFLCFILNQSNVYASDTYIDNQIQNVKTNPIAFDYSAINYNDCWDVNDVSRGGGQWIEKTPTGQLHPILIGVGSGRMSEQTLCQNLVFYNQYSDANRAPCLSSDGKKEDPICLYYKGLYNRKNDEVKKTLFSIGVRENIFDQKYRAVKACQWLSDQKVCVPKNNVALSSNYSIPMEKVFPFKGQVINSDSYSDSDFQIIENFYNMVVNNDRYLANNMNLASALGLIGKEKLAQKYWKPEQKQYIRYSIQDNNSLEANSVEACKDQKTKRVIELNSVPCDKFDNTDTDIIALLSNKYSHSFSNVQDGSFCNVKVVVVKSIEREGGGCSISKLSQTFQNTMFVYNDDYLAFIPVLVKENGEKYSISLERPKAEKRYDGICEEIRTKNYNLDTKKILTARAIIGFNPGYSKAIDAFQLISKGDLSLSDGSKFPQSLKKLLSIKTYCPNLVVSGSPTDPDFERFNYGFNQALAAISKDNKAGYVGDYLSDNYTLIGPSHMAFSNSQFSAIFSSALRNGNLLPKAYRDEIKSVFEFRLNQKQKDVAVGSLPFYSSLADSAGFTSVMHTNMVDEKTKEEQFAIAQYIKKPDNFKNTYNFFISNAFAQTPITGAENVHYYMNNSASPEYNQLGTVAATSANYLYGLDVLSDAVSNPIYVLNPSASAAGTGSSSGKGQSGFAKWLGSDGASKLGMLALSYWMTSEQQKLDSERIKSQLELEMIKSRMNQCSSLDCTIQQELCLMQKVKCRTDRKILGIKIGRKDDMCYKKDLPKDSDEAKGCYTCSDTLTATQTYLNPYTGESKLMTLYEICLMNVTNSLLNKNKCFDLIEINTRTPGLLSESDIRNCFLGLTPTKSDSRISYIPGNVNPKASDDKKEEKKAEEKKAAAAGAGSGSGSAGSASSPGSSVKEKESPKMNDMNFGRYNQNNENYQRYPGGSAGYGGTGSYNANSGITTDTGSGLKTMKPVTSDGLTIINMIDGQRNIAGDKTK